MAPFSPVEEKSLNYAIVVLGGSAGALPALQRIIADLPEDLPAAVFVATHVPPDSVSAMPHILSRSGPLFATHAIDRAPISPRQIIVAPPNRHLALEDSIMRVVDWARENGQRPSIDVLFRTAASAYGQMVCGTLLSGTLDDGVAGLREIRKAGGTTLCQDPADALFPDMPRNAINADAVDIAAPADDLATAIVECVEKALAHGGSAHQRVPITDEREVGAPAGLTCPDCGGSLWEAVDGEHLRFRCHTGHAYNMSTMLSAKRDGLETALWSALRIIQERINLLRRLASRAETRNDVRTIDRFSQQIEELRRQEETVRLTLVQVVEEHPII
jgi:two-component system, chemotaxis family, protein-glutamate methylesterase/glutaminase